MIGPENTFIASVHKYLPPMDAFYRMKNHNLYNGGIADVWYSNVVDLWIEYKFVTIPKRADTIIDLRAGKQPSISALQVEWLTRRKAEGRNVWIVAGSKEGGVIDMALSLFRPIGAAAFRGQLLSRSEIANQIEAFCS